MARLTADQWEQARADYEVRGVSLGDIAKRFSVATSSVSRRARAEGWVQGKMQGLVERKVAAVKELAEIETQTQDLPLRFQHTIESVAQEQLQAEGALASLDIALALRASEMARTVDSPDALETLTRARRNLAPKQAAPNHQQTTTVNVQQAQATGIVMPSPRDALAEIVRQATEEPDVVEVTE